MTPLYGLAVALIFLGVVARHQMRRDPAGSMRRVMRGRWVSRPALRVLGPLRAVLARVVLSASVVVVWAAWVPLALSGLIAADGSMWRLWLGVASAEAVWDVDDWLTGDDDGRRRRPLERALARLRAALRPLGYSTSTGGRA